uniref:Uncharacterized protein n=1 Tax=Physcomitrium patens TaxID=3218 RepID=A0A2K1IYS7_PHYPA|nr:hypothetical protein PHYPA_024249 [Physcomitrium patens]
MLITMNELRRHSTPHATQRCYSGTLSRSLALPSVSGGTRASGDRTRLATRSNFPIEVESEIDSSGRRDWT